VRGYFTGKEKKMKAIEDEAINSARYNANGYKDREDYLTSLAKDFGIDRSAVNMISDILGPSEDFDGLVSALEDFESMALCDE
jgi:hypothetical protein